MFVVGAALGFVLGARAGRGRYEQIKSTAQTVADSPAAKNTVGAAQQGLDVAVDALHRATGRVTETSREIPARIVHTTESLRSEINSRAESLRQEITEANERTRQRQAETVLSAGDLRDGALDDLGDNDDDAMLDEHGADDRNLNE
jgi:gas vesicle protein